MTRRRKFSTPWSERDDLELRRLIEDGMTWRPIAVAMGRHLSDCMRRGSVLGIKTLRPARKQAPEKPESPRFYDRRVVVPDFPTTPIGSKLDEKAAFDQPNSITVMEAGPLHCRWPIGDDRHQPRCCGERITSRSYCSEHTRRSMGNTR